ncbi:hypothetical protein [Bergeyella zoohelcum]|uniref:Uncharacterized protein n=1 Tax=Bergeyella zoohelcum ATCC 43767 TaxID=883096 RepID=K1LPU6_9FLAO|nr:hypothetical protein [Bergeyella zoohelcum]EKB56731.1 hypothetical protein HMPREF9699_01460 [Bergeyella zoohelcum ATCC 43767]SUV48361.1 Uncharacterised protein [Bergeyella zoohelcum]
MLKAIEDLDIKDKKIAERIIGERNIPKLKSKLKENFEKIFEVVN